MRAPVFPTLLLIATVTLTACREQVPEADCESVIRAGEDYVLVDLSEHIPNNASGRQLMVYRYKVRINGSPSDSLYLGDAVIAKDGTLRIDANQPFPVTPDYADYHYLVQSRDKQVGVGIRNIHVTVHMKAEACACCYETDKSYALNNRYFNRSAPLQQSEVIF